MNKSYIHVRDHIEANGGQSGIAMRILRSGPQQKCHFQCKIPFLFGALKEIIPPNCEEGNWDKYPKRTANRPNGFSQKGVTVDWSPFLQNIDRKGDRSLTSAELAVAFRNLTVTESIVTLFREKVQAVQEKLKADHPVTPPKMNSNMRLASIHYGVCNDRTYVDEEVADHMRDCHTMSNFVVNVIPASETQKKRRMHIPMEKLKQQPSKIIIKDGLANLEQNLTDDEQLNKALIHQTKSSHKFITSRVEELLHNADFTLFQDNYWSRAKSDGRT